MEAGPRGATCVTLKKKNLASLIGIGHILNNNNKKN